jgi:sugar phosphate isomerase/epimerase
MATTIKGPAIFIAQFIGNDAPFNNLKDICNWAVNYGYNAVQLPTNDARFVDLKKVAESKTYADEIKGIVNQEGLEISELSTRLQGQLVADNPAFDELFDGFAPKGFRKNPKAKSQWAIQQLKYAAQASKNLNLNASVTFSGSLMWHTVYPFSQCPSGLVDEAFKELAIRWKPILDVYDECGVDLCYEIHPREDLHDGATFDRFLEHVHQHPRACVLYNPLHFLLQCMDYLEFIDIYHERIKMFQVEDADFNPTGKHGAYDGFSNWNDGNRFRSLGSGHIDFRSIFSKLAQYNYDGWAVYKLEFISKCSEYGAKESANFIKNQIIKAI